MPWKLRRSGDEVLVVREDTGKVVARHKSRKKALRQLAALYSVEKASFANASDRGRYAAEQRWKGNALDTARPIDEATFRFLRRESRTKEMAAGEDVHACAVLWVGRFYQEINQVLRGRSWREINEWREGDLDDDRIPRDVSRQLTPYIAAETLVKNWDALATEAPKDVVVFRGVPDGAELVDVLEIGEEFTDDGVIATSADPKYAREWGDGARPDLFMEIRVPKGTKMWSPSYGSPDEQELCLRPQTRFRVVDSYPTKDKDYGEGWHVVVEVVDG